MTTIPVPGAILIVSEIGAWSHVDVERTSPIEEMQVLRYPYTSYSSSLTVYQVWDGISDARIDFNAAALGISTGNGRKEMARLIETLNLQRGLLRHLGDKPNVTLLDKTKVETVFEDDIPGGGWPILKLSDGRALRARLLVCSTTV